MAFRGPAEGRREVLQRLAESLQILIVPIHARPSSRCRVEEGEGFEELFFRGRIFKFRKVFKCRKRKADEGLSFRGPT
jgi:hypothetical protein